jgi:hypothetical protein
MYKTEILTGNVAPKASNMESLSNAIIPVALGNVKPLFQDGIS